MHDLKHPQDVKDGYLPEVTDDGFNALPPHIRWRYKPTGSTKPGQRKQQQVGESNIAADLAGTVSPG